MLTPEETLELSQLQLKLCPPPPELDEKDHIIASTRYAFDTLLWDMVRDLMTYVTMKENLDNQFDKSIVDMIGPERVTSNAVTVTKRLAEKMESDEEPWDIFGSSYLRIAIGTPHNGDCTAFPGTCERCWAEEQYKVPFTAVWTKAEGCRMYHRMVSLKKKLDEPE